MPERRTSRRRRRFERDAQQPDGELDRTAEHGPPITDYDVRYREVGSGAAFTDAQHSGTARTATLTGLIPDTAYEMQVRQRTLMEPARGRTPAWGGPNP